LTDLHNAFLIARESVSAESAAVRYGLAVKRHRAPCPFHNGRDYNLSFRGNGFHCFVCGEKGDSIRFTQLLLRLDKPFSAVKRLNEDFSLRLDFNSKTPRTPDVSLKELRKNIAKRDLPGACGRILWEYALNLDWVKHEYTPESPCAEHPPDIWVFSLHEADYAEYLLESYENMTEQAKLAFIENEKENLKQYEKFNRVADRLRRGEKC
jgi:hypothetical protein